MLASRFEEREEQNFKRLEEERKAREKVVEALTAQPRNLLRKLPYNNEALKRL